MHTRIIIHTQRRREDPRCCGVGEMGVSRAQKRNDNIIINSNTSSNKNSNDTNSNDSN